MKRIRWQTSTSLLTISSIQDEQTSIDLPNIQIADLRKISYKSSDAIIRNVAPDAKGFRQTLKFLFRWRQSIYKLLWKHALIYISAYLLISCLYRYALVGEGRKIFEAFAKFCSQNSDSIHLVVIIGFFTSTALKRYSAMQLAMPGAYRNTCMFIMSLKPDLLEGRAYVATFARWQVLCWIFTFRNVCPPLRRTLPNLISLQKAGLLTAEERMLIEQEDASGRDTPRTVIVTEWMLLLLKECHNKKYFCDIESLLSNVNELIVFKGKCGYVFEFSFQNIPKALVQAVIITVYSFGVVTLFGRSIEETDENSYKSLIIDFFPILPALRFFVYLSWLAFGKAAINPFGDDEDDIDVLQYVNGHIQSAMRLPTLYSRKLSSTDLEELGTNDLFSTQTTPV